MIEAKKKILKNERGIALLIVLLVTALLIALVFEFAYATRISLNSAANFRDNQRAYFIARSGIYAFIKSKSQVMQGQDLDLTKLIHQGELREVPGISAADTVLKIEWEDESGKIMVGDIKTNPNTQAIVKRLFENKQIDTGDYDRLVDPASTINKETLLTALHQYMNDEDFLKVSGCLTMSPVNQSVKYININATSADVLQALSTTISSESAHQIVEKVQQTPVADDGSMPSEVKIAPQGGLAPVNFLTAASGNIYKVYSEGTVGGFTKQIEAIVRRDTGQILYWRAL